MTPSAQSEDTPLTTAPGPVLLTVLGVVVVSLAFGLGATLDKETARTTLVQHKLPPFLGVICQYVIMPAIAFGLSQAFGFSSAKSMGLLFCGIVPGGSTSNLFTYYIGGDVGLSIFMTVTSTLLAIAMIPLLLWAYGTPLWQDSSLDDTPIGKQIPYASVIMSLVLVLLPTMAGIYLRSRSLQWAKRAELVGSVIGVLFILVALISGITDNMALFGSDVGTWIASAALSVIGFVVSILIAMLFRIPRKLYLTIGLEVGVQNTILAITLAFVLFADAEISVLNEALVFPLMCSLWDVVNSVLLAVIVLWSNRKNQASDESTSSDDNGETKNDESFQPEVSSR